ncbi:glutaminase B [Escherichia coli]|nr:glutaminase B [Escherichia coli]EED0762028.1 glutaminase B [Escherichia coli]EED1640123.1 glutaminase B [Escherichia coli]EEQ5354237.1 glutaminase B [Escherichia coli]EEQ5362315.1 glutaminase B [Escherichia coli]
MAVAMDNAILENILRQVRPLIGQGKVADYIPALATVDGSRLGIAICTVDGQLFQAGDAQERFSIQSISKVLSLVVAMRHYSEEEIWQRVGKDPSGSPFNSLVQLEMEQGIPRNPFINAGALVVCDMLQGRLSAPRQRMLEVVRGLSGVSDISYDTVVARSEFEHSARNAAIAWLMKSFGNFHHDVTTVLQNYFHYCALKMSCVELARTFVFLANQGKAIHIDEPVVTPMQARQINALMATSGMYQNAGEFAWRVGLPAKSGVGGGIVAIVPHEMAIAVWSPELDDAGNSLAGIAVLEHSEYDEFLKLAHNPEMRFVFSNTTEAGISYHAGDKFDDAPAVSYPAKLTRLLFERFSHFNGALDKGWIIIPCELIDYNGDALRELVLRYAQEWALPEAFIQWLDQANSFCSTLVDRIVTGYPRDEVAKLEEELGYHDGFLDTAEHFYLFVIQGPKSLATELRLDKYPLNVLIVDDIKPYKERKVAILNGAHTALVPVAFQAGLDTVGEAMNDAEICAFVEKAIYEEIIPVLDLPRDELESFASAVTGRFRNPYIKHQLLSIALNGMTKFRTRILPQLLAGQKANGTLPARLTFALAALIAFYRGERNGETYPVQDDAHWLERYQQLWSQHRDRVIGTQELVAIVLAEKDHWEQDLTQVPGLVEQVANDLDAILEKGMREAVRLLC